jgi:hypothetical protein
VWDTTEIPLPDKSPVSYITISECQDCLRFLSLPLPIAAAYHPESISFHWKHGVDILGTGVWEFNRHLHDEQWTSERIDTDPDRYRIELRRETSTLRLFLNQSATVTRTERVRRRNQNENSS